jgi:hypothetical protein
MNQWRINVKLRRTAGIDVIVAKAKEFGDELLPEFPGTEDEEMKLWYYALTSDQQSAEALADHLGHQSQVESAYAKPKALLSSYEA